MIFVPVELDVKQRAGADVGGTFLPAASIWPSLEYSRLSIAARAGARAYIHARGRLSSMLRWRRLIFLFAASILSRFFPLQLTGAASPM